eukprot:3811161-Amphidinium_carterae.1
MLRAHLNAGLIWQRERVEVDHSWCERFKSPRPTATMTCLPYGAKKKIKAFNFAFVAWSNIEFMHLFWWNRTGQLDTAPTHTFTILMLFVSVEF